MTTINLKDFYSWYTQNEYMEVSDEVAEELRANKRYESAYRRRVTRNKAQYSLDCDDGTAGSAVLCAQFSVREAGAAGRGPYSRWKEAQRGCRGGGCYP